MAMIDRFSRKATFCACFILALIATACMGQAVSRCPTWGNIFINCGGEPTTDGYRCDIPGTWRSPGSHKYTINRPVLTPETKCTEQYASHASLFGSSDLVYKIPVVKGTYKVALMFMETWKAFGAGDRLLTITVNGKPVEVPGGGTQFDIWSLAGGTDKPYVVTTTSAHGGGDFVISIGRVAGKDNPMISGISISGKSADDLVKNTGFGSCTAPFDPRPGTNDAAVANQLISTPPPAAPPVSAPPPSALPVSNSLVSSVKAPKITWTNLQDDYPLRVFEASGTVMGSGTNKALVVFGGFKDFPGVTTATYQRSFTSSAAKWTARAAYPRAVEDRVGATHMAQCLDPSNPNLIYLLGGYAGKHPGNSMNSCYAYNRLSDKYTTLPNLPGDRAGGGCVVVRKGGRNMIVYTGGVDRVNPNFSVHNDHSDTWTLNLNDPNPEWKVAAKFKNPRNHMAGVEACGRYFFVGGQKKVNENTGNQNTVSEWFPDTGTWSDTTIANLPYGLGHISASVMPWKCGLIVVGGIVNGVKLSDNILHWSPKTNKWNVIGKYPHKVATPVCGIVGDQIICATGGEGWSHRNKVYSGMITS